MHTTMPIECLLKRIQNHVCIHRVDTSHPAIAREKALMINAVKPSLTLGEVSNPERRRFAKFWCLVLKSRLTKSSARF